MEVKNREKIEGKKIEITKVRAELNAFKETRVHKVYFETNEGTITAKPKEEVKKLIYGIETSLKLPCEVVNLPKIIKDIGTETNAGNKVIVLAHFIKGDIEIDGELKTYRWVQGDKMLESWKLQENTDETVVQNKD